MKWNLAIASRALVLIDWVTSSATWYYFNSETERSAVIWTLSVAHISFTRKKKTKSTPALYFYFLTLFWFLFFALLSQPMLKSHQYDYREKKNVEIIAFRSAQKTHWNTSEIFPHCSNVVRILGLREHKIHWQDSGVINWPCHSRRPRNRKTNWIWELKSEICVCVFRVWSWIFPRNFSRLFLTSLSGERDEFS